MSETTDETIKNIIFKYIVKPDIDKKTDKKNQDLKKSICAEIDKSLTGSEQFV
jgi:hypothetical protein